MSKMIKPDRYLSVDALRGLAILLMVLSGSIAFGDVLPAWMYHAQVPPPKHVFNSDIPGITWVDLVFPFFLFAMGASVPFALNKKLVTQGEVNLSLHIIKRYFLLVIFAIFTFNSRAWVISTEPGLREYLLSIGCFLTLFLMYSRFNNVANQKLATGLKVLGYILAAVFLAYSFTNDEFNLGSSDIIVIVLANMALFGSFIWWLTRKYPLLRISILPLVMAVLITAKYAGSWNSIVFNWSPFPWMYKFYYLKYLFIVLPGTLAGEWLMARTRTKKNDLIQNSKVPLLLTAVVCLLLLISNLICLYGRWLVSNLFITTVLSVFLWQALKRVKASSDKLLYMKFAYAGIYLLILGLFFEAFEGGIKKDVSTFSYYFVSTGLGFLTLLALLILERQGYFFAVINYVAANGKNPMIAYTAGNLFLIPILNISGADFYLNNITGWPGGGFLRGLVFTGIVSLITLYCTKKNLYWRT